MNKILLAILAVYLSGYLVCMGLTVPLVTWALREDEKENGIIPKRPLTGRDVGAITLVSMAMSVVWFLMIPLYVLMLAEKITGRGGKK